jgi:hypothetical protein
MDKWTSDSAWVIDYMGKHSDLRETFHCLCQCPLGIVYPLGEDVCESLHGGSGGSGPAGHGSGTGPASVPIIEPKKNCKTKFGVYWINENGCSQQANRN